MIFYILDVKMVELLVRMVKLFCEFGRIIEFFMGERGFVFYVIFSNLYYIMVCVFIFFYNSVVLVYLRGMGKRGGLGIILFV